MLRLNPGISKRQFLLNLHNISRRTVVSMIGHADEDIIKDIEISMLRKLLSKFLLPTFKNVKKFKSKA